MVGVNGLAVLPPEEVFLCSVFHNILVGFRQAERIQGTGKKGRQRLASELLMNEWKEETDNINMCVCAYYGPFFSLSASLRSFFLVTNSLLCLSF